MTARAPRGPLISRASVVGADLTSQFAYETLVAEEKHEYSHVAVTEELREGGLHAHKSWRYWHRYLADRHGTHFHAEVARFANTLASPRILSLGCGYGGIELAICDLLTPPYEFIAVDLNPDLFPRAERVAREKKFNLRFEPCDMNFAALERKSFDLVMAHASLHHLLNLEHICGQVWGALREHGRLICVDMIGKTHVLFWKENAEFAAQLVRRMPPRYTRGLSFDPAAFCARFVNPPAQKGMEGIRQEEIEGQILRCFKPVKLVKYGSFIRLICTHPVIGARLDPDVAEDRKYLESLFELDLQQVREGKLRPTEMFGVFEKRKRILLRAGPPKTAGQVRRPAPAREPPDAGPRSGPGTKPSAAPSRATLTAAPNPVPNGPRRGATTIEWNTGDGAQGAVFVSVDRQAEQLFSRGAKGSQKAAWIGAGSTYEFRLYKGPDRAELLARVQVARGQPRAA